MPNYRRHFVKGGCYFFTVALADRRLSLLTEHIDLLRDSFRHTQQRHPFHINAIVILPEHLHCIWTLPENDHDYPTRWRLIKTGFSRKLPLMEELEHRSTSRYYKGERGIWQRRYWEHTLRDEKDFRQHVDYIHHNPVKHGYVSHPAEWNYSSFRRVGGAERDTHRLNNTVR